uniref:Uncharacterized protein n=1 Tax=Chrysemys picta bellii TaxID=8478 RepID=A0A8C3P8T6_CHRPI
KFFFRGKTSSLGTSTCPLTFRIPLNLLACLGMLILHDSDYKTGTRHMFTICSVIMVMVLLAIVSLFTVVWNNAELRVPSPQGQNELSSLEL